MFGWFGVAKVPHRRAKMKYRLVADSMPNGYALPSGTGRNVEQGVHGLLQHPPFVAHDDLGRVQFDQPLEAAVAIDHPPVCVVQVRGHETTTVDRHQTTQLRRDDRNDIENHALGLR